MKRKANISFDLKTSNVTIRFDLGLDLDLEFSRSNMELVISCISQPKMVWLPLNEKQTHRLNFRPEMCPSDLTLAMTFSLNFQGQIWNLLYLNQKWSDCREMKSKHIDMNSRPQMWPMGLTLAMTLIHVFEFSRSYVIFTICWPRSGVRIYQIVTGVTSDVGVPSTHLVTIGTNYIVRKKVYMLFQFLSSAYLNIQGPFSVSCAQ